MRVLVAVIGAALLGGCSFMRALDYDGNPKKSFEFRFGWDHGIEVSKAKPGEVDKEGVYQPETSGVDAVLSFPGISTGIAWEARPDSRITATVGIELFRVKTPIPYARWWVFEAGGGAQLVEIYAGKLLVPIVDVTAGPWVGWDFDERKYAWGLQATIFKF
jgi:hypothetical protein